MVASRVALPVWLPSLECARPSGTVICVAPGDIIECGVCHEYKRDAPEQLNDRSSPKAVGGPIAVRDSDLIDVR